jgi:tRNA threonylcarbamoyladenosine biosynthesis protein TsaE
MQKCFTAVGIDDLPAVAEAIIAATATYKLVAFYGQMGAGKTTLIKQICKQLQVQQEVSSPTFSLVNEYTTANQQTVYHFDFYRIKNIEEVYDIGYEDYFFSSHLCLLEWPENIEELLNGEAVLKVNIALNTDDTRIINLSATA